MIRVVLVDDHRVVVEGLKLLLQAYPDVSVVGSAGDGAEGADLVISLVPDVVLMDLSMPGVDGIQATRRIVDAVPDTAVVVLTTSSDREMVLRSLDAGAVGYLMKDTDPQALYEGIQAAAAGGSPIDPRVARALVETRRRPASGPASVLTAKQREVLELVAAGQPNRLVAKQLGVTEKTVKAHLTQIYAAIGVSDRVQATLWARDNL
ncbi:MAG: response regulator transcription factor [Candidatus Nanopelagicales bacterium]|jgi:DNA-binding NarL/FixJ family response regulator|nr:response regulator transcription factor [Actinomycetota bacterium]HNL50587.1 response regulator transcription factor [Actinomycetota bacterium]HNO15217.1 response regulator transcription factor [Actinomycetota bacterium]HUM85931.1 response regulator transcription factor [Actinomycetota bacterium]